MVTEIIKQDLNPNYQHKSIIHYSVFVNFWKWCDIPGNKYSNYKHVRNKTDFGSAHINQISKW